MIDRSGPNDKETYRNTFTDLDFGHICIGINRSRWPLTYKSPAFPNADGLRILCSTFENNGVDIEVDPDAPLPGSGEQNGINGIQSQDGGLSTDNVYSSGGIIYNTTGAKTLYFENGGTTQPVTSDGFSLIPASGGKCMSHIPPLAGDLNDIIIAFRTAKKKAQDSAALWAHLMDSGNTDSLVTAIRSYSSAVPLNTMLSGIAPFLSDTCLKAAADSGQLSDLQLHVLLNACPDLLHDTTFLNYFGSRIPHPLSRSAIVALHARDTTTSRRTELEWHISDLSMNYQMDLGVLITYAKSDTSAALRDSIPVWLGIVDQPWAIYERASFRDHIGDSVSAIADLHRILTDYPANYIDTANYMKALPFYALRRQMHNHEHDELVRNSAEQAVLDAVIDGEDYLPIQTVATGMDHGPFHMPTYCYETVVITHKSISGYDGTPETPTHKIHAYPNPAFETVNFDWNLEEDGDYKLIIINSLGQPVGNFIFKEKEGSFTWNTGSVSSGNYFYRLSDDHGMLDYGKLVIIKR